MLWESRDLLSRWLFAKYAQTNKSPALIWPFPMASEAATITETEQYENPFSGLRPNWYNYVDIVK